jgi:hypothetical protein
MDTSFPFTRKIVDDLAVRHLQAMARYAEQSYAPGPSDPERRAHTPDTVTGIAERIRHLATLLPALLITDFTDRSDIISKLDAAAAAIGEATEAARHAQLSPGPVVYCTIYYGSCSSLSRHLVGVGVPALVGLLGVVLMASAP